jgi:hypothetical protein
MKVSEKNHSRFSKISVVTKLFCLISVISAHPSQAAYHFDVFTSNGSYYNEPGTNMYAEMSGGTGQVDFTFHNENSFPSSIARIYFETDSLLGDIVSITNGPGTDFSLDYPGPVNMPAGRTLDPLFKADISIGAESPPPKNGINPSEWLKVSFGLPAGKTLATIADLIERDELRIGIHVLALPDGSSEVAIMDAPDPATIMLFGFGALAVLRRRRE